MKCINKKCRKLLCILCMAAIFITGCGSKESGLLENPYSLTEDNTAVSSQFFAQNLCVTDNVDFGIDQVSSDYAEGAGAFNLTTQEVLYSHNLFEKLYPASTTKIMTAYIIIKNCDLDEKVTVSTEAVANMADSSKCGVAAGDTLTVRDLLYGLMLVSGNDAANVLAEHYSGSIQKFAEEMNKEALSLGATHTHFVNANGLPDDDHYTTVYDMYLIFQAAIQLQEFEDIIKTQSYDASYTDTNGNTVTKTWANTNQYLSGAVQAPDDITVIGGKTGTTNAAGYCLVLYSKNKNGDDIVSIVFKAEGRSNLYALMNQILSTFAN
ncbi:MAG: D-alanyl-D-alanine carboxypeptidase family protein [Agathobacter sp.]|nr:D-alanyl-D-alanine carboxypeptidase family protein [Agathobacter sp.]